MSYDESDELTPVTLPVRTADGEVVQMSQAEVAQGLPPGAEIEPPALGLEASDDVTATASQSLSATSVQEQIIQHAVHLSTIKLATEEGTPLAPQPPAPTSATSSSASMMTGDEPSEQLLAPTASPTNQSNVPQLPEIATNEALKKYVCTLTNSSCFHSHVTDFTRVCMQVGRAGEDDGGRGRGGE